VWSLNDRQRIHGRVFAFDCPTTTSSRYPLLSSPCPRRHPSKYHCTWTKFKERLNPRKAIDSSAHITRSRILLLHAGDTWLRLTGLTAVEVDIRSRGIQDVVGQSRHAEATALPSRLTSIRLNLHRSTSIWCNAYTSAVQFVQGCFTLHQAQSFVANLWSLLAQCTAHRAWRSATVSLPRLVKRLCRGVPKSTFCRMNRLPSPLSA